MVKLLFSSHKLRALKLQTGEVQRLKLVLKLLSSQLQGENGIRAFKDQVGGALNCNNLVAFSMYSGLSLPADWGDFDSDVSEPNFFSSVPKEKNVKGRTIIGFLLT